MSEHLPDSQIATNMTDTPANVYALNEAGFRVTYIKGSVNRYRIEDQEPQE